MGAGSKTTSIVFGIGRDSPGAPIVIEIGEGIISASWCISGGGGILGSSVELSVDLRKGVSQIEHEIFPYA